MNSKVTVPVYVFLLLSTVAAGCTGEANAGKRQDDPLAHLSLDEVREMADGGDRNALFSLGDRYFRGRRVARDDEEAFQWLLMAADEGHMGAQARVGVCYADGRGVEKDYELSAEYYLMAAEQGHPTAQAMLGTFYARGTGVEEDPVEAYKWFYLAEDQGYGPARLTRDYYVGDLRPAEVAEARRRAREFRSRGSTEDRGER